MTLLKVFIGMQSVLILSSLGAGSWKSKPPAEWTMDDVAELLERSPWTSLVMVKVLHPGGHESSISTIRFCWISEPVDHAVERHRDGRLFRPWWNPWRLDPFYFFQYYDALTKLRAQAGIGGVQPVYILVDSPLLSDMIRNQGRASPEKVHLRSSVGVLPATGFFYGVVREIYNRDERGIAGGTVRIEDLKRIPPKGAPLDLYPRTRAVYEFQSDFPENEDVSALLLIFDRERGKAVFDEETDKVTAIIPFGDRSLQADFHPKKMRFDGKPSL